jgi:hypothetical protein
VLLLGLPLKDRLHHAAAVPPALAAHRTRGGGSGSEAAAPPSATGGGLDPAVAKAVRKQRLLQDKNRRAQARFRERQRVGFHVQLQKKRIGWLESRSHTAPDHGVTASAWRQRHTLGRALVVAKGVD